MKYERITERRETPFAMSMWASDSQSFKIYNRLAALEDKIESGELIERTSEEYSAVRKQDVEVCKEVVKECLQVLRDMRMVYIHGYYSSGWNDCIDRAIEQLTERYNIDTEEVCGE